MAITKKEEARALSADEQELVDKSHHPVLQELPDGELSTLVKLMRNRREKARRQADQRRREMRGKSDPRGAAPSQADDGSKLKVAVLAMAMRRLNSEIERRRRMAARASLVENARNALAMKRTSEDEEPTFNSRHAHKGMQNSAGMRAENLIRPMERGRLRKAASVAQAKRDTRGK